MNRTHYGAALIIVTAALGAGGALRASQQGVVAHVARAAISHEQQRQARPAGGVHQQAPGGQSRKRGPGAGRATKVRTGGITYPLSRLEAIQRAADRGDPRYRYTTNPVLVTLHDLPGFGFVGSPIQLVSPGPAQPAPTAHTGEDTLPETDVIVRYRHRKYWIVLNQFIRHGPGGIWSVITITPM